ncbi:MAG: methyltransferase domain-containing protein, partial [Deltaproteobacteria bacterium]|nr:methyltransferase domain-containing protein [Deltaproteobacteria bacterium]
NDGLFLDELHRAGVDRVMGLEPNPYAAEETKKKEMTVHTEMINQALCHRIVTEAGPFDTVVSRQVIEHLTDIEEYFTCVDILLAEGGHLFVDFPDFEPALIMGDCSMIWEEHVNYFTEMVARNMLGRFGYRILACRHYNFSGGTIALLAQRGEPVRDETGLGNQEKAVRRFNEVVTSYRHRLSGALASCRNKGVTVVLYGVGCRACTVVNGLQLGSLIDLAVDDQVERQGKYMPGSRIPIHPSETLRDHLNRGVCLLAVNQENEAKVRNRLTSLSKDALTCVSLFSPNDIHHELTILEQLAEMLDDPQG